MLIRVAFHIEKTHLAKFYGVSIGKNILPEPHYNLAPGHQLFTIIQEKNTANPKLSGYRWGGVPSPAELEPPAVIGIDTAAQLMLKNKIFPCAVPISGFYMWKNEDEKDQPFFVRMMNTPVMSVAGIINNGILQLILTKANTLIEPMSAKMPMVLNRELSQKWLQNEIQINKLAEKAATIYFLTDFTVLKVSKKVSNASNNVPSLIQPIPK